MSPDELRRVCLEHPGAEETFPFGHGMVHDMIEDSYDVVKPKRKRR